MVTIGVSVSAFYFLSHLQPCRPTFYP